MRAALLALLLAGCGSVVMLPRTIETSDVDRDILRRGLDYWRVVGIDWQIVDHDATFRAEVAALPPGKAGLFVGRTLTFPTSTPHPAVVAHEAGHAIGLGHAHADCAVMNETVCLVDELQAADVAMVTQ